MSIAAQQQCASALAGTGPGSAGGLAAAERLRGRLDWTLLGVIAVGVVVIQARPGVQTALQFDKAAIAAGRWWLLVTGQLVHFGWWNMLMNFWTFAVLYLLLRCRGGLAGVVVMLSAVSVGLGIYFLGGGITTYRGLSGVAYAMVAYLLVDMALAGGRRWWLWAGALLVVAGKSAFESLAGVNLLPTSAPEGVVVAGSSHISGLAAGAALRLGITAWRRIARRPGGRPGYNRV